MRLAALRLTMWLLGRLPLRANHALGALLGQLAWLSGGRLRKITETNLQLCYPHLPAAERQALARDSLQETGKSLTSFALYPSARIGQ